MSNVNTGWAGMSGNTTLPSFLRRPEPIVFNPGFPDNIPLPTVPGNGSVPEPPGYGDDPPPPNTDVTIDEPEPEPYFDADVFAQISQLLNRYGLGSLTGWVRELVVNEASANEIEVLLYERQEFKNRFPAIALIDAENRGGIARPNITPEEYLNLEQDYHDILARVGLNDTFFTPDRVANWIYEGVSPAEVSRRVTNGYSRMTLASPETKQFFQDAFGEAGESALAAYFLDADNLEDVLMREVEVAEIGGRARIAGIGVGPRIATKLAELGITPQQAHSGFQSINSRSGLFRETVTENTDLTKEGVGLRNQFGLDSGQSEEQLTQRLRSRQAAFRGGGGAFIGQKTTGFGAAD